MKIRSPISWKRLTVGKKQTEKIKTYEVRFIKQCDAPRGKDRFIDNYLLNKEESSDSNKMPIPVRLKLLVNFVFVDLID